VGCGTARDIEFVLEHVRTCGTKVYLVDLSDALLEMARERVARLGLTATVELIEGDINDTATLAKLPQGGADMVTCSYCLTMIPPWQQALETMVKLTKPGGYVGLVDFTTKAHGGLWQGLYRWWFANDGVYFNRKHVEWLQGCKQLETVWYKEVREPTQAPARAERGSRVGATLRTATLRTEPPSARRGRLVGDFQATVPCAAACDDRCGSRALAHSPPLSLVLARCRAPIPPPAPGRADGGASALHLPHAHPLLLLR
jgi:SAM-dependent methyltransferase